MSPYSLIMTAGASPFVVPSGQPTFSADGLLGSIGFNFHPESLGPAVSIPTSADTPSGTVLPFSAQSLSFLNNPHNLHVAGLNIADGTIVSVVGTNSLTMSAPILGDIPAGTLITIGSSAAPQTTGDTPSGNVLPFASTSNLSVGQAVMGVNIAQGAAIAALTPTSVTLTKAILGDVPAGNTILFISTGGYGSPNWENVILPQLAASGVRWIRAGIQAPSGDSAAVLALYQFRMQQVAALGIKMSAAVGAATLLGAISTQSISIQGSIDLTATLTITAVNFGIVVPGTIFNEAQPGTQVLAQLTGQGTISGNTLSGGNSTNFATGSITFNSNPVAGNSITLNGTEIDFVNTTPSGNQVQIGVDLPTTLNGLLALVQGSVDTNIDECNYTLSGTVLQIQYNTLISGATLLHGNATTAANGFITYASNPQPGNFINLNGTIVTYVAGAPVGNQVQIAATLANTLAAAQAFLSTSADVNISQCTYAVSGGVTLNITYGTVGTVGNSFAIQSGTGGNLWTLAAVLLGGTGTYSVNDPQTFGPGTLTGTYGLLTVAAIQFSTSPIKVGRPINPPTDDPNTIILPGTTVTGFGTGNGSAGTYYVSPAQNTPQVHMDYTDFANGVFPNFITNGSNWGIIEGPNEPPSGTYLAVHQAALYAAVQASPLIGPSGANIKVAAPGMTAPSAITTTLQQPVSAGGTVLTFQQTNDKTVLGPVLSGHWLAPTGFYIVSKTATTITLNMGVPQNIPANPSPPLFVSDWALMGDIETFIDYGNIHPYNPTAPDTGNLEAYQQFTGPIAPYNTKPILVSEFGYTVSLAQTGIAPVAPNVTARYIPRLFIYDYTKGTVGASGAAGSIVKTFYFQMIPTHLPNPTDSQAGFGLINYDGSLSSSYPNQNGGMTVSAWGSFTNLMNMFSDPGPPFTIVPLNYSVTGGDTTVKSAAFQKRNGTYLIAVWIAANGWNDANTFAHATAPLAAGGTVVQVDTTSVLFVGVKVSGTNIPAATTITAVTPNSVTLSNAVTGSGIANGQQLTFVGQLVFVSSQSVMIQVPGNYVSLTSQVFNDDGTLTTTTIPLSAGTASNVAVYDKMQVFTLH